MTVLPIVTSELNCIPVSAFTAAAYSSWLQTQSKSIKSWLSSVNFKPNSGNSCLIPDEHGSLSRVALGLGDGIDFWSAGGLSNSLPNGVYKLDEIIGLSKKNEEKVEKDLYLSWCLGAYSFEAYKKKSDVQKAKIYCPPSIDSLFLEGASCASYLSRDLINTPAGDLGPAEFQEKILSIAELYGCSFKAVIGEDLLVNNFPAIHAVGRASNNSPRLISFDWGEKGLPLITLVGKGVCFDTGGLNIKSSRGMQLMKKDMGGAATVLGLADWIMRTELPLRLKVVIPAVDNSISGNSFRPGDVIKTRSGKYVEIVNTDAEGRLILSDALTFACEESPDLLVNCATLTGAARVGLGPDLPALFSNNDLTAEELLECGNRTSDHMWRLPLWKPYNRFLSSKVAEITNADDSGFAGSITAALFLNHFIPDSVKYIHLDMYCWNNDAKPGRPQGGYPHAQRALYDFIKRKVNL